MAAYSPPLVRSLRKLGPRLHHALAWLGLSQILVFAASAILASFLLDRWLELPFFLRFVLLLGFIVSFWRLLRRARRRLRQSVEIKDLIRTVESYNPDLEGHLANALELPGEWQRMRRGEGDELELLLLKKAIEESRTAASQAEVERALDLGRVWRWCALSGLLVGLFVLGLLAAPRAFSLWFERNVLLASTPWPRETHFVLDSSDSVWHHARHDPLEIKGWVAGNIPREVTLELRSNDRSRSVRIVPGDSGSLPREIMDRLRRQVRRQRDPGSAWEAKRMGRSQQHGLTMTSADTIQGRRLQHVLAGLSEDIEFVLKGGDNKTSVVEVVLHDRPRIASTRFALDYPEYLGQENQTLENPATEIAVPFGTDVRVAVTADVDLASGWIRYGAADTVTLSPENGKPRLLRHGLRPEKNGFLDLAVADAKWNLESSPPLRYTILVLPDQEPLLTFELLGESSVMTPQGTVRYRIDIEDDHGFSNLDLRLTPVRESDQARGDGEAGVEPLVRTLEWVPEERAQTGAASASAGNARRGGRTEGEIDLATFALAPRDRLYLQAAVTDNDAVTGPKTILSQKESILILDPETFKDEMRRRRLAAQTRLEALAQREERVAETLRASADDPMPVGEPPPELASAERTPGVARTDEVRLAPTAGPQGGTSSSGESGTSGEGSHGSQGSQGDQDQAPTGLSGLAEEQRRAAREAEEVRDQLVEIQDAMRRNQLTRPSEERRFEDDVARPLDELARESLPKSSDAIEELGAEGATEAERAAVSEDVERLADSLQRVAKRIGGGGGDLREILGRLELIIDLQDKVKKETEKGVSE